ncbi:hypothetical protein FOXG_17694 [Fusarium oxysporum f. sp. lycopersici 4287]|uniref:Uncharacterized protein n=2 Tax=Fusarium oxysporum TaxID=5507 RepID=A0A0J9WBL8_FUSO4|nr:uncharacterized protein FOXG_17694 [Fusarium oxysporum f. sp. lycopersici 4287]KNB20779.1 hypothetical protein FOXG_17694 [Fusarium oxysporum f. sp. lycopersici 4287]
MAPVTPSRPSTARRSQHVTPPKEPRPLAEELQEVPMEIDEEGDIKSPPIHPNSHEDEVKKLKKKLRNLGGATQYPPRQRQEQRQNRAEPNQGLKEKGGRPRRNCRVTQKNSRKQSEAV